MKIAACLINSEGSLNAWRSLFDSWGEVDYFIEPSIGSDQGAFFNQFQKTIFKKYERELLEDFEYDAVIALNSKEQQFKNYELPEIQPGVVYSSNLIVTRWPGIFRLGYDLVITDSFTSNILADYFHYMDNIKEEDIVFDKNYPNWIPSRKFYYYCIMSGLKVAEICEKKNEV